MKTVVIDAVRFVESCKNVPQCHFAPAVERARPQPGQIPKTWLLHLFPSDVQAAPLDHVYLHVFSFEPSSLLTSVKAQWQRRLKGIVQKHPNDIVFLSALRTPVARSYKEGLRSANPEQMLAAVCLVVYNILSGSMKRLPLRRCTVCGNLSCKGRKSRAECAELRICIGTSTRSDRRENGEYDVERNGGGKFGDVGVVSMCVGTLIIRE